MKIIRRPELRKRIPASDATVDRLEDKGEFPKRVQISANSVGWIEEEVDAWIASRVRGPIPAENVNALRDRAAP